MRAVVIATERDHPLLIAAERAMLIATERILHRKALAPLWSCRLQADQMLQGSHVCQG